MRFRPKSLSEQTIVVTGATSGIGLTTARLASSRGARVVVSARSEDALRQLVRDIEAAGGQAAWCTADVGEESQVRHLAEVAIARFGGFDTWVNDAGASVYAPLMETTLD